MRGGKREGAGRKVGYSVKNHESDPSISCEVDQSFVPTNPDHLEGVETGGWKSELKKSIY